MEALARRAAAPVFALALFSSAALIFVLQPLFGRMVTPYLGGSPAVWNTSMAFFQGALLLGYVYAHLLARLRDLRLQALIHTAVLALAFLALPIHVSALFGAPSSEHPALWLLGVLTVSVGAPFAAASATAPLLQSWYARTGRADSGDPYYLYAASNLGSFGGLLAYPILIEPLLGAAAQAEFWRAGYILVVALILACAAAAIAAHGETPVKPEAGEAPSLKQRLYWLAAAAVPSALVLGVTLHISTDVASAPMLWVIPLALYLLTFVLAFMKGGEKFEPFVRIAQPLAMALLVVSYLSRSSWHSTLGANLIGFFLSALVCHMALARARPHAGRLTEFYFWVSLGGVLGGAFAAFLAPVIFNDVYEYPLALAAAALFLPRGPAALPRLADVSVAAAAMMALVALLLLWIAPHHVVVIVGALGAAAAIVAAAWGEQNGATSPRRIAYLIAGGVLALLMLVIAFAPGRVIVEQGSDVGVAAPWSWLILIAAFVTLTFSAHASIQPRRALNLIGDGAIGLSIPPLLMLLALVIMGERLDARVLIVLGLGVCAIALFLNRARPWLMAGALLLAFAIVFIDDGRDGHIVRQERSFFGVLRTTEYRHAADSPLPPVRVLMHGTTIHGAQLARPDLSRQPLTYYHQETALGEAILAGAALNETARVALIGLGAGSTACLLDESDSLTIFEIDPAVVRLAAAPGGDFTFVPECQPGARVVLGDARLRIAEEPDGAFDVIVVDAFSSDAIPAHLLTREALALYLSKTSENGVVVLHLSNRNLALVSEAARVVDAVGAHALWRISRRVDVADAPFYGALGASVMVVAQDPLVFGRLPLQSQEWQVFEAPPGPPWTDDYVNLPRALWDTFRGAEECRMYPTTPGCAPADVAEAD